MDKGSEGGMKNKRSRNRKEQGFFPKNASIKTVKESTHSFNILRTFSKLINYGFSLFYVGFILSVWFYPEYYNAEIIYNLTIILIFEFILVHSGVFMAVIQNKLALAGFALFYGIFALAINTSVLGDAPIILYLYSATVINRMVFGLTSRTPQERQENMLYSALMALNFMFCIFAALILSFMVPYGGLTPSYLSSISYFDVMSSGGEFPEKPHVAFAFGVMYFSMPVIMPMIIWFFSRWYKSRKQTSA
ncbi:hypothetical protein [Providencia heimbachae]|uniref:Uncharacterized protein n=1 Tax=Providencia heimbachae ATCC 35613 TaxID=1354272 RepID=A0A1B7JMH6_9GAMM|nr:hypothetical protein [Providencia heimbachae]OAT49126.1 hypothetical protein M998_3102 [Providencia heimbachae ATCC 35613]SQH12324.1 Uncharacterised protein [Providencia heimbachae]